MSIKTICFHMTFATTTEIAPLMKELSKHLSLDIKPYTCVATYILTYHQFAIDIKCVTDSKRTIN